MKASRGTRWFQDLSLPITPDSGDPLPATVQKLDHREGATYLVKKLAEQGLVSGKLTPQDFPGGEFLSNEFVSMSVHTGTHLDAPYHFGSSCESAPAATVDQIPLDWLFGPGVVLDVSHRGPEELITAEDIRSAVKRLPAPIAAGDIVLIRTGADKYWGTSAYATAHPGMSAEATLFLIRSGVRVMGIDAAGFDLPTATMVGRFEATGDPGHLWPAHFLGREHRYCHIERLCNLDKLPGPQGFDVACFPIKVAEAGAAWTRVVAIGTCEEAQ